MSFPVLEARWLMATKPFRPVSLPGRIALLLHALAGKLVFYRFLRLADHVVVQSKRMREVLEDKGLDRARMTPVEMGVTTERYNPDAVVAADDERLKGRRVIGYLSSEFFGTAFEITLGAVAQARQAGHDAVLLCVGPMAEHQHESLPEALALAGLPLEAVVNTGRLPLPQALSYVKAADVCISPIAMIPQQEVATPTKLVEYLAMGRPVVASVLYDHCEVVGGSGAGLVAEMTPAALGEALARILDDREWAEEMGARGPAWVKANRDYARLADRVERLFGSLLRHEPAGQQLGEPSRHPAE
jgi:glycosyltransferase involved in cell wall biosynthesis